jgi:predicted DNA-binding transcriptional regulator AlpA
MLDRKQIADMLGVKVPTFRQRVEARPDFPKPTLRLSRKTVRWEPQDIHRWIQRQKSAQT